jgi:hypothetical protein
MREKEGNKLDDNADDFIKGDEDHFKYFIFYAGPIKFF